MWKRYALFAGLISSLTLKAAPSLDERLEAYKEGGTIPSAAIEFSYFFPQFPSYGTPTQIAGRKPGTGIRLGVDWMPLVGWAGKLGVGFALGYGKVNTVMNSGGATRIPFLEAYPLDADLVYRFDFVEDQLLVPFARVGVNATLLQEEYRKGGLQSFYGWYYAGGLAVCLDFLDAISAEVLNASTGIDNTYLLLQYKRVQGINPGAGQGPDLSRDELQASLRMEF
ncbi:hypothetical protein K2X33_12475 [bacterium]|nr:hypothetical protein [bacterium]